MNKRKTKDKRKLFIICSVASTLIALICIIAFYPRLSIKLTDGNEITVPLGEKYVDPGYKAYYGRSEIGGITVSGKVDTERLGTYSLTYSVTRKRNTATAKRTVTVADLTGPVINTNDSVEAFKGYPISDIRLSYTAIDRIDGDCTATVKREDKADHILLTATDKKGNVTQKKIAISFIGDNSPPSINLNGGKCILISPEEQYTDPGFTAIDDRDGDITYKVSRSGTVDTKKKGTYKITYTVSDIGGNTTTETRYIIVTNKRKEVSPGQKVIYLTFDDGPSDNTPYLLDILKEYGVKATFFVTAQHPKALPYIERIKREGHTVAAHTYSHKWELYSSIDSYFDDLNKINEIIIQYTGKPSRFIRFPGGSSNVVSAKYKKGIMSEIVGECYSKGYIYFDWNVDSLDTSTNDPGKIINNVIGSLGNGYYNVLMHDTKIAYREALPAIIQYGLENGYTFLPIDETSPAPHHTIKN